jgi:hypothetical protein
MHSSPTRVPGALLVVCSLVACTQAPPASDGHEAPAHVEHIDGTDLSSVTLTEHAIERIGLETAEVYERMMPRSATVRTVVPYSALLYDPEGRTWIYTGDEPRTFVRQEVVVDYIDEGVAVLTEGPAVGTVVASVGVAELYGTEFEVGH